jgi:hypothetical protein
MNLSSAKGLLAFFCFSILLLAGSSCEKADKVIDVITDSTSRKLGWKGSDNPDNVPENLNNPFEGNPNDLPGSVDLSPFFPPIGDQGQYGTCVAWATGYNAKTALEAIKFELNQTQLANPAYQMSAKYLFTALEDNAKGADCNGSDFTPALEVLLNKGVATKAVVPYQDLGNCSSSRLEANWNEDAAKHKIKYYRRIDDNIVSVKQALAAKMPVIIGAKLDDSFMAWNSESVYQSATTTNNVGKDAYHALCIVGYDNNKGPRGAFKVVNSWSDQWGAGGFIWVDYNFMFSSFVFNKNFFVAVNDDQKPNPTTDPSSGVELSPWVDADFPLPDSGLTWRQIDFDIFNTGTQAAPASQDWGYAYLYYNAYDANDYGVIFYDRLKNQGAYQSISFGQTDSQTNSYGFTINANIPAGKTLSAELFTGFGIQRTYVMPSSLNGAYYLVLVADITDKFVESDETNNLFYTTDQEPKGFDNGMSNRMNMMSDHFRNAFTKSQLHTNAVRRYNSAVKPRFPNAYTPEEILTFLKREARNGNLARKITASKAAVLKRGTMHSK